MLSWGMAIGPGWPKCGPVPAIFPSEVHAWLWGELKREGDVMCFHGTLKSVPLQLILHHCALEVGTGWGPALGLAFAVGGSELEVRGQEPAILDAWSLYGPFEMWLLLFSRSEVA